MGEHVNLHVAGVARVPQLMFLFCLCQRSPLITLTPPPTLNRTMAQVPMPMSMPISILTTGPQLLLTAIVFFFY